MRFLQIASLVLISLTLNLWNNSFPLGYHFDEAKKVHFVATDTQDFHHPVLLLELVRFTNITFVGTTDPQEIVQLGRTVVAIVGSLMIVCFYLLSLHFLSRFWSWIAALSLAVCPTIVIHAHYLKEDVLLTCFCVASLWAFVSFVKQPSLLRANVAGFVSGLAFSSHYKSILLLPLFLLAVCFVHATTWKHRLLQIFGFAVVSGLTFLAINSVLFEDPNVFLSGVAHEHQHAINGHTVPIRWNDFYFLYHFWYSVLPGMTIPMAIFCCISYFCVLIKVVRKKSPDTNAGIQLLLVFCAVFYAAAEISPSKPNPDECRYILPVVPLLIFFGVYFLRDACAWFEKVPDKSLVKRFGLASPSRLLLVVVFGGAVSYSLYDSAMLNRYMINDTRKSLERELASRQLVTKGEPLTNTNNSAKWGFDIDIRELSSEFPDHYVCGSFGFDIFLRTEGLANQSDRTNARRSVYKSLLSKEAFRVEPAYRSFAFSNPTLIVVELESEKQ